jgi:hypothetical protein
MSAKAIKPVQPEIAHSFDLIRLSHAKQLCDFSPNTVRSFFARGLRAYRHGKMVMFSRSELEHFLKTKATA